MTGQERVTAGSRRPWRTYCCPAVRRRATGMTADAVAAALEEARFFARQDSRHEDLADDPRGRAELAEWERIDQLLAAAGPGGGPRPAERRRRAGGAGGRRRGATAREADLREAARIEARADELQALRELGALAQAEPEQGDEAVRDLLTRRAGHYVQAAVDAWFAHALAIGRGPYADPPARQAAVDLLPRPIPTHAALLAALAPLQPSSDVDVDQLAFAGRLANADADLAAFPTSRASGRHADGESALHRPGSVTPRVTPPFSRADD
ncbi:hypothetical protein [Streptomyces sp. NPDC020983]|uniref:hypothetical protein n=1 Tax=Streptomyces sp. NPDC020983 TaxID=3365106 RepID=UPI0037BC1E5B